MSIHSASPVDNAENQGPLLRVDKVSLEYKTPERRVRATHQVSFDVHASERFILLGPSGCGKSTLLKAVAGFIKPTEGRIALDDRPVQGGPGPRRGVPGIRPAAAVEDAAAERGVSADRLAQAGPARGRPARHALPGQGRAGGLRRRLSPHLVRRHEAARGDRARAGHAAARAADGRALRRAGRADAAAHAGRVDGPVGRGALHAAVRHSLHRRGAGAGQPRAAAVAASGPRARRAERAGAQPAQPGLGGLPGGHAAHSRSAVRPGARAGARPSAASPPEAGARHSPRGDCRVRSIRGSCRARYPQFAITEIRHVRHHFRPRRHAGRASRYRIRAAAAARADRRGAAVLARAPVGPRRRAQAVHPGAAGPAVGAGRAPDRQRPAAAGRLADRAGFRRRPGQRRAGGAPGSRCGCWCRGMWRAWRWPSR